MGINPVRGSFLRNLLGIAILTLICYACSMTPGTVTSSPKTPQVLKPPTTQPVKTPTRQLIIIPTITPTVTPTVTKTEVPTTTPTGTTTSTPTVALVAGAISWQAAREHVGEQAIVCGPVVEGTFAEQSNGKPTFLNLGLPYPDQGRFTILIWGDKRARFSEPPEVFYLDKNICITGMIELYQGVTEMIVREPGQIVLHP